MLGESERLSSAWRALLCPAFCRAGCWGSCGENGLDREDCCLQQDGSYTYYGFGHLVPGYREDT